MNFILKLIAVINGINVVVFILEITFEFIGKLSVAVYCTLIGIEILSCKIKIKFLFDFIINKSVLCFFSSYAKRIPVIPPPIMRTSVFLSSSNDGNFLNSVPLCQIDFIISPIIFLSHWEFLF